MSLLAKHVIVVDDDLDILNTVKAGLVRAGFEVHGFSNPVEALDHVENGCKNCNVIVSDVRMPIMNGFQLVRRVNEVRPDMKIIIMTAFELNKSEFEKMFPKSPVERIIRKPFAPSKLAEVINELYPIKQSA